MGGVKGKKTGVVVGHGCFDGTEAEREILRQADVVVAADGGARYAWEAGRRAEVVVGDGDSLGEALSEKETERPAFLRGCRIVRVPREKDETDLELALDEAVRLGCREVVFLGALGGRLDHTLANLQLLAAAAERGVKASLVDADRRVYLLAAGDTLKGGESALDVLELSGRPGEYVSLLPVTPVAAGIWTEGLKYPLQGEDLYFGRARGVSNEFLAEQARVCLTSGMLLVVVPGGSHDELKNGKRRRDG
ncbi:MAG: thiamine diphosphokinase [Bacillota bacterium]|nr:thiamine diphosphokinase [Bacillota bacterium]